MSWYTFVSRTLMNIFAALTKLDLILDRLHEIRKCQRFSTYKPRAVTFMLTQEIQNMLFGKLVLPAPGASDVVARELTFTINGTNEVSVMLAADALESEEISVEDNAIIAGSLVDIDDAGNRSTPSSFSVVVVDTIAPPQPGQLAFVVTREEDVAE